MQGPTENHCCELASWINTVNKYVNSTRRQLAESNILGVGGMLILIIYILYTSLYQIPSTKMSFTYDRKRAFKYAKVIRANSSWIQGKFYQTCQTCLDYTLIMLINLVILMVVWLNRVFVLVQFNSSSPCLNMYH